MENTCALILAGGLGTRFYPVSTSEKPKQFLNLIGDKTMIQMTIDRISKIIPMDKIFVIVREEHKKLLLSQIPNLSLKNIIIQPSSKNTAPCICLGTSYIEKVCGKSNIIALPSDHIILKEEEFLKNIKKALIKISTDKSIVTLGIYPTRPEVGYGYIKVKDNNDIAKIDEFVEKPNIQTAISYIKSCEYLWNAGIFVYNSSYVLDLYKKLLSNTYNIINNLPSVNDKSYLEKLKDVYSSCDDISFDKAIMEKTSNNFVIPSDIGWDDVGTWQSLQRYLIPDSNNNISNKETNFIDSKGNIVYTNGKKITILGLEDIMVIDSDNEIVIAPKSEIDNIHKLQKKGN